MPRRKIALTGGLVFHVINRGVRRMRLFDQPGDYRSFERLLKDAQERVPLRILAYCLMPNHFHLVLWPSLDGDLTKFMNWLTLTHSKRWHVWRGTTGTGPVYQGRFRAGPVQTDEHLLTVLRYVERNPLRAGLVSKAEEWEWSSLAQRCKKCSVVPLTTWPIPQPNDWSAIVNDSEPAEEIARIRRSVRRNAPYGGPVWTDQVARALGLSTPGVDFRPHNCR